MSGDEFDHLLLWLDPDRERAGERYEILRRKLAEFFGHRGCICPEELADQTLDRVAHSLAKGEVIRAKDPMIYCLGVARNVRREYRRSRESRNEQLESLPPHENLAVEASAARQAEQAREDQSETERRLECLTPCLNRLAPESRALIEEYYRDDWRTQAENRKQMAERLGLDPVGLRTRAHRIRQDLKKCVMNCLKRARK